MVVFFFQAEDGIRDLTVTGVQTCALPISATSTIPIVGIDLESDPVASGWVRSLNRPGGNLTGLFLDLPELGGKQIQLFKEAVPRLSRVAGVRGAPVQVAAILAAAGAVGGGRRRVPA